jgi:integrase
VLAVTTGMRQGELFALRWDAVDLETGFLAVTGNLQTVGSKLVVQPPKTQRSRRRVELSKTALAALKRRRAIVDRDGHGSPYVFAGADGGLPRKYNVMRRSFRPLLERAEIPTTTTFHALRHTAASVLLLQGTNPKIVSELLGHADVRLTLNTYSDVLPGLQRQAADAMELAIRGAVRKNSGALRRSAGRSASTPKASVRTRKSPP